MLDILSEKERNLLDLIIQGENYYSMLEWLGVDYNTYVSIKRTLLKKLGVRRITELLFVILKDVNSIDEI